MASNIQSAITALISAYTTALTTVETIVQKVNVDLKEYAVADLPLLAITLPTTELTTESSDQLYSRTILGIEFYYVDWANSATTYQTWVESLIEATPKTVAGQVLEFPQGQTNVSRFESLEYPLMGFKFTPVLHTDGEWANI